MLFFFLTISTLLKTTQKSHCRQSAHTLFDGVLPSRICPSQARECAQCLEGSFSSSKDANCCRYAFSLVLDISTRNLYGHMPFHSGIGYSTLGLTAPAQAYRTDFSDIPFACMLFPPITLRAYFDWE